MFLIGIAYFVLALQFILLLSLSVFGMHRASMVYNYLRGRNKKKPFSTLRNELPFVTVQLPVYNEPAVIERLIRCIAKLDYPKSHFEIQVLDDSTDSTRQKISQILPEMESLGVSISHIRREQRTGYKAGALAEGLEQAKGEFVAIFDADFLPRPDFLQRVIPHFEEPSVAMVQTKWSHLNRTHSLLTRAQAVLLDGHFQIEHTSRYLQDCFFNFNGTAGVWRISSIVKAGGWEGDTLTEDLDLSYRAQLDGAKFVYLLDHEVPAELPIQLAAFKSQQHRWTKGSVEVFKKLGGSILKAKQISPKVKREAFFHLAANFCYPILALVGLLLLPALEAEHYLDRTNGVQLHLGAGASIVVVIGFVSLICFYAVASLHSKKFNFLALFIDVPLALATGVGLSISNSIAVYEALLGKQTPFQRTPKSGSEGELSVLKPRDYFWRQGLVKIELVLTLYFICTAARAINLESWGSLPFIGLFLLAFAYFSGSSLKEAFRSVRRSHSAELLRARS